MFGGSIYIGIGKNYSSDDGWSEAEEEWCIQGMRITKGGDIYT